MRDRRFVAVHRGGPLTRQQHHALIEWAAACVEHVLSSWPADVAGDVVVDVRLRNALIVAEEWVRGTASVGDARQASLRAIACANEATTVVAESLARAAGHAVATAHMADHAPGAALYALQAVERAAGNVDVEKHWQRAQLPDDVFTMVEDALDAKERFFLKQQGRIEHQGR